MTHDLYPLISLKEEVDEKVGVRLAHSTSLAQGCTTANLACWGSGPLLPSTPCAFSKRHSLCSQKPLWSPLRGYAFHQTGPQALGSEALFSHLQGLDHRTPGKLRQVQEEIFNASPATILTVRVCEQLNIVGFLYLLVPFLYPVLEKTFYSFLVQKKLMHFAVQLFSIMLLHPLSVFLGIHLPAEGFIKQPSALSQPLRSHCLHT